MTDRLIFTQFYRLTIRQNYRQSYDASTVAGIRDSILKHGFKIDFPIPCYQSGDSYVIVDGHTRYHACLQVAEMKHSKHFGVWIVLKDKPTDKDFKLNQLSANELRKDPDDMSRAIGYKQALDYGASVDEIAANVGHTRQFVEDRLSLLQLVPQAADMVAKGHFGIKSALQLTRLDSNFQAIALQAYIAMKSPTLEEFTAVVNDLYTKQNQSTIFDLALFTGKPIEDLIDSLNIERQKSRLELLAEIDSLNTARQMDRDFAKRKFQQALREIEALKRQLTLQKAG